MSKAEDIMEVAEVAAASIQRSLIDGEPFSLHRTAIIIAEAMSHSWPRTISVEEKLPEQNEIVLAYTGSGWHMAYVHPSGEWSVWSAPKCWLPLPPAPEEKK